PYPPPRLQRAAYGIALVVGATLAGTAVILVGCDKEKSGAEKMADEMAKSASVASMSASVDAAPDPAELKYASRKKSLEQAVTDMKADEAHVMANDPSATPGILRHYFESGAEGDKAAKELEAKRKKDGVDGYRIKKAKIADTRLAGTLEDAELDVVEETTSKGTSACLLTVQQWKFKPESGAEKWIMKAQLSVKKVDCE
ncbi:MAG: hypothetical protein ABI175_21140, partial [Polyangiales bacterium]